MYRTVHWNDIGNTSAGEGKGVKEEITEHVEATITGTRAIAGTSVCGTY